MEYLSPVSLQIYKEAIEAGSFRLAAKRMQISQPAVSAHIQRLEKALNVALFEKPYRHSLCPTEAGELLYQYVVDYSAMNTELLAHFDNLRKGEGGEIKFALSICTSLFARISTSYLIENKNVNLSFRAGNGMEVKNLVQKGEVDFGIVQRIAPDPNIESEMLFESQMQFFCSPFHPLADLKRVLPKDLAAFPIIRCLDGSHYNLMVNEYLLKIGYSPPTFIQVEDGTLLMSMVENGYGFGILSARSLEDPLQQGRLKLLQVDAKLLSNIPKTECQIIYRRASHFNPATEKFIGFIKQSIRALN